MDTVPLLDAYRAARRAVVARARWDTADQARPGNTCCYCGKHWRRWAGSQLDGHSACFVTEDFKRYLFDLLRSPTVTYAMVAAAIGVTPSVVRSWTFHVRPRRSA